VFNKSVLGNNLNTIKATIAHPYETFDATYSGFEDFIGRHNLVDWDNDDYKDEKWFTSDISTGEETGFSTIVPQNPCNHQVPPGGLTTAPGLSKHLNHIMIDNVLGLNVGDIVEIELTAGQSAVPTNFSWNIETTITEVLNRSDYLLQDGTLPNWIEVQFKDYILCFSDPLEFPESSETLNGVVYEGVVDPTDEGGAFTISETKILKKNPEYNLSKTYSRTGKYSYKLPTIKDASETPNKTAVRPIKLNAPSPAFACLDPYVAPLTINDCQWSYEASVWLKYDSDITSIGVGDGVVTKSADIQGDVMYQRGDVSESDNLQGVKIICDVYNFDHTVLLERKEFYPEALSNNWKQYTVNMPILKGGTKWLDVYVQNERQQIGVPVADFKSVFADDIIIYPTGAKYSYDVFDKYGNVAFAVDNNDVFVEKTFDDKGRSVVERNIYGNIVAEQSYFEQANWTNQVNHITNRTWVDNQQYNETRMYIDGFGKVKQTTMSDQNRNARIVTENNLYNDKGFVTTSTKPYVLIGATLTNNVESMNSWYSKLQDVYSSSNAVTNTTFEPKPEQIISTISLPIDNSEAPIITFQHDYVTSSPLITPIAGIPQYDAGHVLVHEVQKANGNIVRTYMDNFGRVIMEEHEIGQDHVQNSDGSITFTSGSVTSRTWFEYDGASRITKIIDPTGKVRSFVYNSIGVMIIETSPDNGTTEIRYDRFGQVRFVKDQKDINSISANTWSSDQFSFMKYDAWGRLVESGQYLASPSSTTNNSVYFDDYSKINDQEFPSSSLPLVQIHNKFVYDGTRQDFNSDALLSEIVYDDHIANPSYIFTPQKIDKRNYTYLADGQLFSCEFDYDGLDPQVIEYTYNDLQLQIGKKYIHPNNPFYNFEWKSRLDNFARVHSNSISQNGSTSITGTYYYDILGHLLMTGLGETGNSSDPHVDYQVYRHDIRDQLTNNMSKNLRFGLKYDPLGNLTDQYWSNEHFDPTDADFNNGGTMNIHHYKYYFDKMNRLVGGDYSQATLTSNPFDYFNTISNILPSDFNCTVNEILFNEYMYPTISEFNTNIEDGVMVEQSTQGLNSMKALKTEYKRQGTAYSYMTEQQKGDFLNQYLSKLSRNRVNNKSYELYMADKNEDQEHYNIVMDAEMNGEYLKYTRLLLEGIPFNSNVQCTANSNATVYGYLPEFDFPESLTPSNKYDVAYCYSENGNIIDLNRNDENGDKAELDYNYVDPTKNQLSSVVWSGSAFPTAETHQFNYDACGNIIEDNKVNAPENISFSYGDFNNMPKSITTPSGTSTYRYDTEGLRTIKNIGASDKEFFVDGVILDENGDVLSYQTNEGYVRPSLQANTMDIFYYQKDWIGTNRGVLDANGVIQNVSDHYPFGKKMPDRFYVSTDVEGNRYQFTGHEYDNETEYGYHGARYYNREIGRYMNVDPVTKFHESSYAYAANNPIVFIDVNGEDTIHVQRHEREIDLGNGQKGTFIDTYADKISHEGDDLIVFYSEYDKDGNLVNSFSRRGFEPGSPEEIEYTKLKPYYIEHPLHNGKVIQAKDGKGNPLYKPIWEIAQITPGNNPHNEKLKLLYSSPTSGKGANFGIILNRQTLVNIDFKPPAQTSWNEILGGKKQAQNNLEAMVRQKTTNLPVFIVGYHSYHVGSDGKGGDGISLSENNELARKRMVSTHNYMLKKYPKLSYQPSYTGIDNYQHRRAIVFTSTGFDRSANALRRMGWTNNMIR